MNLKNKEKEIMYTVNRRRLEYFGDITRNEPKGILQGEEALEENEYPDQTTATGLQHKTTRLSLQQEISFIMAE